jgi:hypothetical protein
MLTANSYNLIVYFSEHGVDSDGYTTVRGLSAELLTRPAPYFASKMKYIH